MNMKTMTRTLLGAVLSSACACAWANPTGIAVVRGDVLVSNPSSSVLQVVNTPGTILNWQSFSIGAGQTTRFVQLNAASAVLNRVVGASPSDILGRLESNGRVFLINPNGIVFGNGSVVDVAGLIASTRDITDANFLAGNYLFSGTSNGSITLQSGAQVLTSTYGPGGQVWLFAKNVTQEAGATITAPQGQVVLAAGSQLQVAQSQLGNMTFTVNVSGGETIELLGAIAAERGAVGLFADTIKVRDGGIVNVSAAASGNGGSITANARNLLEIERLADMAADGGSSSGNGGTITLSAADVRVSPVANAYGNVHASARAAGAQHGNVTVSQTQASTFTQVADVAFAPPPTLQTTTVNGTTFTNVAVFANSPEVAVLADGSYVVVWNSTTNNLRAGSLSQPQDILAYGHTNALMTQRFQANGTPIGQPITISSGSTVVNSFVPGNSNPTYSIDSTNYDVKSSVAALRGGGYVVLWQSVDSHLDSNHPNTSYTVITRMLVVGPGQGAQGTPITVSVRQGPSGNGSGASNGVSVAALANGGYVGAWGDDPVNRNVLVQRFNAIGSVVGAAQDLGVDTIFPKVAGVGDGGYVVTVFRVGNTPTNFLRFDGAGQLATSSNQSPAVIQQGVSGLVGGGYAVGEPSVVGTQSVQQYSANGTAGTRTNNIVDSFFVGSADGSIITNNNPHAATGGGGYAQVVGIAQAGTSPSFNLRIMAKQALPSTAGPFSGEAGASASFATAPGVAQVTGGTPPTGPGTPPTTPAGTTPVTPPTVVTGRPGGGARFDGIAGCDFTCAEAARNLQAAVDAMISASATSAAIDAMIAAAANRAAVDAMIADDANKARAAADAQRAAQKAASTSKPGGAIDEQAATEAVVALQRAAKQPVNTLFAQTAAILLIDEGEYSRLVRGNRFDQMTPAQRLDAIAQWLEVEGRAQAADVFTQGASVPRGNIVTYNELVGNGDATERRALGERIASRQAAGLDR